MIRLLTLTAILGAGPQQPAPAPDSLVGQEGEHLRVFLVTYGQGDVFWESFGHNALWIQDQEAGTNLAYDWGVFTFDDEFLPRFLKGTMMYGMGRNDALRAAAFYQQVNRTVHVQELALTGPQKVELQRRVRENYADPTYRYDYFLDNCSTRVRDMLDVVLDGALSDATKGVPDETWRFHTRRLTQHNLPLWAGLEMLLGNPGDAPIRRWDALYVPMELEEALREVTVPSSGGGSRPLVASERSFYDAERPAEPEAPAGFHWVFLVIGAGLGVLLGGLGRWAGAGRGAVSRVLLGLGGGAWSLLAGVAGVLLVLVWFTDHIWMYWNENLFQFNPVSLAVAALLPVALWRGRWGGVRRWAAVAAGLSVAGALLQILPGLDQGNGELIALALPVHVGLWWGLRGQREDPERDSERHDVS